MGNEKLKVENVERTVGAGAIDNPQSLIILSPQGVRAHRRDCRPLWFVLKFCAWLFLFTQPFRLKFFKIYAKILSKKR